MDQNNTEVKDKRLIISDVVKEYPNMLQIVIYHDSYALYNKHHGSASPPKRSKDQKHQDSIDRSVRRTRTYISDIILSNRFDLWCTFTFSKEKVDRYNAQACRGVMSGWLHRQAKHSPNMQYVIVPEYHKDGALHFHALISGFNGRLKDSGKLTSRNQHIYNMTGYRAGFTEIVKIGEYADERGDIDREAEIQKIGTYIAKYISKDTIMLFGKKRYWCSQGLTRPTSHVNGVSKFNLWNLVKRSKPVFMNGEYEMFHIPFIKSILDTDNNTKLF